MRTPASKQQLADIDRQMQEPGFWDDPARNAAIMQQRRALERRVQTLKRLRADADELAAWEELLAEGEADPELATVPRPPRGRASSKLELELKLSGPDDEKNAILAIHPGAGGTESQDWAEMLLRMYLRWAERQRLRGRAARPAGRRGGGHQERHASPSAAPTPTAT